MIELLHWAARLQNLEVLPLLLKITLIAAIGRLLLAAMPRAAAAFRCALAVATLASMLLIVVVAAAKIEWRIPILPPASGGATVDRADDAAPKAIDILARQLPSPAARGLRIVERVRDTWRGWLLLVCGAVATLAAARLLFGIIAVRSIARVAKDVEQPTFLRILERNRERLGIARPIRVVTSDRVTLPAIWGVANPVLLLPEVALTWPAERLEAVVLHELAHVARRDVLTVLFTRAVTALFWFHPLAWSLHRLARRDCERACDDVVLAAGTPATAYADHLFAIARSLPLDDILGAVTVAVSRPSELEGRLLAILKTQSRRGAVSIRTWSLIAMAMAVVTVPLAAVRLVAQPFVGVKEGIKGGIAGGVSGGVQGGIEGGVKGGVKGGVAGGVKGAADEYAREGREDLVEGRINDAIQALGNAVRINPDLEIAHYNLACAYARNGERSRAFDELRKAVASGYVDSNHMLEDSDLESLRGTELSALADLQSQLVISNREGSWAAAIPRYEQVTREHPDIPKAWFNLGFVLVSAHEGRRSIEVFQRVLQMGYVRGKTMYNIACAYAQMGQREEALQWLRRSADEGFDVASRAGNDPDLASVRNDPWLASQIALKPEKKRKDK